MPSSPSSLPSALVLLFAVACGLSVANVYYAQPLLDALGDEFAIGQAGVGLLFGATQAGCALALLLVVPLGDLLERRRLMFVQLLLLVLSLLLVGFAGDTFGLALGLLGLGLLGTAMTQGLLAYAAALAALILGVLLLDLAGQAIHVLNQSLVFAIDPRAHSRLVGCYMLFYAAGSGLGASAGTALYAWAGWDAVSLLGTAISLAALAFWWFTRGVGGEARTACANGA
ncbi:MFS transporter [Pseudomonas aeruginosa]|uniref:MFS transporter n=1 Tax=Pseudomonas aeruginosa TaxID=287 RepID=UPI0026F2A8DB|nr:MFS transporter [Pseudomonas aeruginosa]